MIEEKSVVQRLERSIHTGSVYPGCLYSGKHKLVTYYRLNPKLPKNYKARIDLEMKRRSLIKKFQRD
jgi:tRNA G37 N-methylase TrmD